MKVVEFTNSLIKVIELDEGTRWTYLPGPDNVPLLTPICLYTSERRQKYIYCVFNRGRVSDQALDDAVMQHGIDLSYGSR